jgi:hypothetical protein
MKVNKILAFMFILELCIIPLQGCGAKSITADSTETQETQAQIDDAYGKGLSFTYNDYADERTYFAGKTHPERIYGRSGMEAGRCLSADRMPM